MNTTNGIDLLVGPPTETVEDWKRKGQQLAGASDELKDYEKWDFGDWLLEGGEKFTLTDDQLKQYAEKLTKRAWKTLKNYKVVSKSFPVSRRRDTLSYSLYVLLTKFNESDQEKALDRAEELQGRLKQRLSVRDFEKEIKRLQQMDELPRDAEDANGTGGREENPNENVRVQIEVELNKAAFDFIDRLSVARYGIHNPKKLLGEMTVQYLVDRKDKLKSMLEQDDPKLKKPTPLP